MSKKRRIKKKRKIQAEKIIGCTTNTTYGLSVNSVNGDIAYLAGSIVIIYDCEKNRQKRFLIQNKKLSSVSYSPSGRYLVIGTSCRDSPNDQIIVYENYVKRLIIPNAHRRGVRGFCWSNNEKYLISFGTKDKSLKMWDPRSGNLVTFKRFQRPILSTAFCKDSSLFVISGSRYVKFYYMEEVEDEETSQKVLKLRGSPCFLPDQMTDSKYVCLTTSKKNNTVYAITEEGQFCLIGVKRERIEKWIDLKVEKGYSIEVTKDLIICGCSKGIVRLFKINNLQYVATIPVPPPINSHITSASITHFYKPKDGDVTNQNVVSVKSSKDKKLSVVYSDRSFFVWDIENTQHVGKYRSFLCHSGPIWGIDVVNDESSPLPLNTIVTCSDDNTIRFWDISRSVFRKRRKKIRSVKESIACENIFCRDLIHVIKLEEDKNPIELNDDNGIRSISFSPNCCFVASGDKKGNLRIHDVYKFEPISSEIAHESEIICLNFAETKRDSTFILSSGSIDRCIHVFLFSNDRGCEHITTLYDHKSAITSVKFSHDGKRLFSCSADKSIVFRTVEEDELMHEIDIKTYGKIDVGKKNAKIYDLDIEATEKYIITCSQDKEIKIWDIKTARSVRYYKADKTGRGVIGEPIKVVTDPSGINAVTSSSDKMLRFYDFYSGICFEKIGGHSDIVTGMKFTSDCKRLVSVSLDGLVIIWRFSNDLTKAMIGRLNEIKKIKSKKKDSGVVEVKKTVKKKPVTTESPILPEKIIKKKEQEKLKKSDIGFRETLLPDWLPNKDKNKQQNAKNKKEEELKAKKNLWMNKMKDSLIPNMSFTESAKESLKFSEEDEDGIVNYSSDKENENSPESTQKSQKDGEEDNDMIYFSNKESKKKFDSEINEKFVSSKEKRKVDNVEESGEEVNTNDSGEKKKQFFEVLDQPYTPTKHRLRESITSIFRKKKNTPQKKEEIPVKKEEQVTVKTDSSDPESVFRRSLKYMRDSVEQQVMKEEGNDLKSLRVQAKNEKKIDNSVSNELKVLREKIKHEKSDDSIYLPKDYLKKKNELEKKLEIWQKRVEERDSVEKPKNDETKETTKDEGKKSKEKNEISKSGDTSSSDLTSTGSSMLGETGESLQGVRMSIVENLQNEIDMSDLSMLNDSKEIENIKKEEEKKQEKKITEPKPKEEPLVSPKKEEPKDVKSTTATEEGIENTSDSVVIKPIEEDQKVNKNILKKEVSPKPSFKSPERIIRTDEAPKSSVMLSKSVFEYQKAIESLRQSFFYAVECYEEVNKGIEESKVLGVTVNDEPVTNLANEFSSLFQDMSKTLTRKSVSTFPKTLKDSDVEQSSTQTMTSTFGSTSGFQFELEKYSDALLKLVEEKLERKKRKKKEKKK